MEKEIKVNGGGAIVWDDTPTRIIPKFDSASPSAPSKYWVVVGTHIKGFARQADAEADAILSARSYPGQTIRVTKTVKAFRTKEPAVETLESE